MSVQPEKGVMLQSGSRPVQATYLLVMITVHGVSHIISYGQVVSVRVGYHIYDQVYDSMTHS